MHYITDYRIETIGERCMNIANLVDPSTLRAQSPYLADIWQQYDEFANAFYTTFALDSHLPPAVDLEAYLQAQLATCHNETEQLHVLRKIKHLWMGHVTYRDLFTNQSIKASLEQVSNIADATINCAYMLAYQQFARRYGEPQSEFGSQQLYIFGMGKLGGRELNFSSDIDLIFCYPEAGEFAERKKPFDYQQFFTKVAQKLIFLLDHNTQDGQVWRVDMRLRPLGDSGPLVMPFSALEEYYQTHGRSWERYAMLKARIINPADVASEYLQHTLKPFIYRRYVDFSVLDSLREMKHNIEQEYRRRQLQDNIKLGKGGIREIEFLVQCFQLIYGGRHHTLQTQSLFTALEGLRQETLLSPEVCTEIRSDYLTLRLVEQRLQQYKCQQTQTLPDDPHQQAVLAKQCGYADWSALREQLDALNRRVHEHFTALVQPYIKSQVDIADSYMDCWQLDLSAPELDAQLPELSTEVCEHIPIAKRDITGWQIGARGKHILERLCPVLLRDIAKLNQEQQLPTWQGLIALLKAVAGRTAYLELILENDGVREQLCMFCQKSEWVIQQLCRFPVLLDELIHPQYLQRSEHNMDAWRAEFSEQLAHSLLRIEPDDEEGRIQALRQFKLAQKLRVAAADILDYLPIAHVSDKLTLLAEVILAQVVQDAWYQLTKRYGELPGTDAQHTGLLIVGYGKLGGIELSYQSDLDLVCLFDGRHSQMTDGRKSISTLEFYSKLVQRIMHLANTKTLLGDLYEIDMRLRPAGNSGVLASSLSAFSKYQHEEAWVWEHQALVRSRPVYGSPELQEAFATIRQEILCLERDPDALKQEVLSMRQKMREHLRDKDKGVMADIEFMTQYWLLVHANQQPQLIHYSDNLRQLESLVNARVITKEVAATLTTSYLTWRHHQHHMSIQREQVHSDGSLQALQDNVQQIWQATFLA